MKIINIFFYPIVWTTRVYVCVPLAARGRFSSIEGSPLMAIYAPMICLCIIARATSTFKRYDTNSRDNIQQSRNCLFFVAEWIHIILANFRTITSISWWCTLGSRSFQLTLACRVWYNNVILICSILLFAYSRIYKTKQKKNVFLKKFYYNNFFFVRLKKMPQITPHTHFCRRQKGDKSVGNYFSLLFFSFFFSLCSIEKACKTLCVRASSSSSWYIHAHTHTYTYPLLKKGKLWNLAMKVDLMDCNKVSLASKNAPLSLSLCERERQNGKRVFTASV